MQIGQWVYWKYLFRGIRPEYSHMTRLTEEYAAVIMRREYSDYNNGSE